MHEKCPNAEFFSGPYFSVFISLFPENIRKPYCFLMFSGGREMNIQKYDPEKTHYLDTFRAVVFVKPYRSCTVKNIEKTIYSRL